MKVYLTNHAHDRIVNRLAGLVTIDELKQAVCTASLRSGDNYVNVKHFAQRLYLGDPADPDTPIGDLITAKVVVDWRGATVITVMLRKSTSQSPRYNS